jgi:hypothetical protein
MLAQELAQLLDIQVGVAWKVAQQSLHILEAYKGSHKAVMHSKDCLQRALQHGMARPLATTNAEGEQRRCAYARTCRCVTNHVLRSMPVKRC